MDIDLDTIPEQKRLLDKTSDELTVKDALKVNGVIIGVLAAVPLVTYGASYATERVRVWKMQRKIRKMVEATEDNEPPAE